MMTKALFIDDSMTSQHLMGRFLRDVCQVDFAPSAEEGFHAIEKTTYDILLVDFLLPGENGLEFIVRVRQMPQYKTTPIIVVSSALDLHLLSDAIRAGANDCLQKPFKKDVTPALVEKMLAEPYIRKLDKKLVHFTCLKWNVSSRHFQYCPDFGFLAEGADASEADAAMHAFLKTQIESDKQCADVFHVALANHLFELKG